MQTSRQAATQPRPTTPDAIRLNDSAHQLNLAATLLITRHCRFDAADPAWPDADRLVAEPGLADCHALEQMPAAIAERCIGIGAGMALAERMLAARFGRSLVDHRCWVLCDGATLATGPVQEAAFLAAAWRLGRLAVLAAVPSADAPGLAGIAASGWVIRRAAADDAAGLSAALSAALRSQKPTLIACIACEPPSAPAAIEAAVWQRAGQRTAAARRAWLKRLARHAGRQDFSNAIAGRLPAAWHSALSDPGPLLEAGRTAISTADTIRRALAATAPLLPDLAMLPGDPAWPPPAAQTEPPTAFHAAAGRLAGGIGACMEGAALHGGVLPLTAQNLACADALLPGLRAAAAGATRSIKILLEPAAPGRDTQGTRAALRAIENLHVFRPADAAEALECLELAIRRQDGPSVLLVSASAVPLLNEKPARAHVARGGYVAAEAAGRRAATLIASGSEVGLALRARALLARHRIQAAVVSLPCWELFGASDADWCTAVLGDAPRFGLEPGVGFGWARWLGPSGLFIQAAGIGEDVAAKVAQTVRRHLGQAPI